MIFGILFKTTRISANNYNFQEYIEEHGNIINSVAFFPNGSKFISASEDKSIKIWDSNTY